jgi:antitoxin PrlF
MHLHYHKCIHPHHWRVPWLPPIEVESTLTDRYQTTVPVIVRHALGLGKRDKIHYTIRQEGGGADPQRLARSR